MPDNYQPVPSDVDGIATALGTHTQMGDWRGVRLLDVIAAQPDEVL